MVARPEVQAENVVRRTAQQTLETAQHTVEEYPISTALAVFGAGLGAGILLGSMLADASYFRSSAHHSMSQKMMDRLSSLLSDPFHK